MVILNYQDLREEVIDKSKCFFCGACQSSCPVEAIEIKKEPRLVGNCIDCGNCHYVCPATKTELDPKEIQNYFSAKSKDSSLLKSSQNGGVASTILKKLLERNEIDAALAVGEKNWKPTSEIMTKKEEVIKSAGTKYGVVPLLKKVKEASQHGKTAIAGTPCHIKGARLLKQKGIGNIKYLISVFCMENFDYNCLINKELNKRGLNKDKIEKMGIDSGKLNVEISDKKENIDLSEIENCVREACKYCEDFAGEYSDISIGSVDSEEGYSTILVRTEEGEKVIELAKNDLEKKELDDLKLVKKLSKIKKK
ncbi:hypothetical protein C9439_02000 [archaeon SCG-AAA382B04]|nr:hypothetical protein C9439_02000 [archaeon SCG-AAA382B04]